MNLRDGCWGIWNLACWTLLRRTFDLEALGGWIHKCAELNTLGYIGLELCYYYLLLVIVS